MADCGKELRKAALEHKPDIDRKGAETMCALKEFVNGERDMSLTQIMAAEALLKVAFSLNGIPKIYSVESYFDNTENRIKPIQIPKTSEDVCYVVWAESTNRFKIGHSQNLEARIGSITTDCPFPIRLVAVFAGGAETEKWFHDRYKQFRVNGEWFSLPYKVIAFLVRMRMRYSEQSNINAISEG